MAIGYSGEIEKKTTVLLGIPEPKAFQGDAGDLRETRPNLETNPQWPETMKNIYRPEGINDSRKNTPVHMNNPEK